jgi:hypothetical protein
MRKIRIFQPSGYLSLNLADGTGEFLRLKEELPALAADGRAGGGAGPAGGFGAGAAPPGRAPGPTSDGRAGGTRARSPGWAPRRAARGFPAPGPLSSTSTIRRSWSGGSRRSESFCPQLADRPAHELADVRVVDQWQ